MNHAVVGELIPQDCDPLKYAHGYLTAQDVVCLGKCFMCPRKQCAFHTPNTARTCVSAFAELLKSTVDSLLSHCSL